MKVFKAFIKPFEAPQRSSKIIIQLLEMHETGRVKIGILGRDTTRNNLTKLASERG